MRWFCYPSHRFLVSSWVLLNACWGCSWNFMRLSFGSAEAPVELWLTGPPIQTSWQLLQDFGATKHISLYIYVYIYIYLNLVWLMMTGLKRLIAKWSFLCGFPGCWISWDTFRFGFSTWTLADLWGWLLGVLQPDLEIISPTPWKINMEAENDGLEDDCGWFLGSMSICQGVWFNDSMLVWSLKNPHLRGVSAVRGPPMSEATDGVIDTMMRDDGGTHAEWNRATPLQDLWLLLVIPLPIFASVIRISWETIGSPKKHTYIYI